MVRRCVKVLAGQEYAAKIINTKKLSARGGFRAACPLPVFHSAMALTLNPKTELDLWEMLLAG